VIKTPLTEVCQFLKSDYKLPYFANGLKGLQEMFPEIPFSCPIYPRRYAVVNYTLDDDTIEKKTKALASLSSTLVPNGLYRCIIQSSTKNDSNAFQISWLAEQKVRLGDEDFK